jgi:hypothetical protein
VCHCLAGGGPLASSFPLAELQNLYSHPQQFVRDSATVEILVPRLGPHGAGRLRPADFFDESRRHKGAPRKETLSEGQLSTPPVPVAFAGTARKKAEERMLLARSSRITAEMAEGRQPLKSEKGGRIGEPDGALVKQSKGGCDWCPEGRGGEAEEAVMACKKCSKEFHVECIKQQWARYRDHFEWDNFVCPYCRCGHTGVQNKPANHCVRTRLLEYGQCTAF